MKQIDINDPGGYDEAYALWFGSLSEDEQHTIFGQVIDRNYPDGFNGFVTNAREGKLMLGVQHGF